MIVISSSDFQKNESLYINQLFEAGLEILHLRKPESSAEDLEKLIASIDAKYHSRIVLHQQLGLSQKFNINRIHFNEKTRERKAEILKVLNSKNLILSTSVHSIEDFNSLCSSFKYAFLSPIYKSISKPNYKSKLDLLESVKSRINFETKLIALGGIDSSNYQRTLKSGFDEVAVLGTIWTKGDPIENFKNLVST